MLSSPLAIALIIAWFSFSSTCFALQHTSPVRLIRQSCRHRHCPTTTRFRNLEAPRLMIDEKGVDTEDDLKIRMKKEGKLQALWNKYGAFYFQVWFSIYLPFLLTFFYILDNNLLQASVLESVDPQAAVLRLFTWLEDVSHNPELMRGLRESPRVTTFATAYLLADLVPTTVFALAAVTFIVKRREKSASNL